MKTQLYHPFLEPDKICLPTPIEVDVDREMTYVYWLIGSEFYGVC